MSTDVQVGQDNSLRAATTPVLQEALAGEECTLKGKRFAPEQSGRHGLFQVFDTLKTDGHLGEDSRRVSPGPGPRSSTGRPPTGAPLHKSRPSQQARPASIPTGGATSRYYNPFGGSGGDKRECDSSGSRGSAGLQRSAGLLQQHRNPDFGAQRDRGNRGLFDLSSIYLILWPGQGDPIHLLLNPNPNCRQGWYYDTQTELLSLCPDSCAPVRSDPLCGFHFLFRLRSIL
jgi:hypothetical protein